MKLKIYGFKPTGYRDAQMAAKSAQLDKFWDLAMKNKAESGPCLKEMVLSENNDPYFCFDGASLLLRIDENKYLDAVLEGVKKCDLKDLQLEQYLRICCFLGAKGKDISTVTEKLIGYPGAKVYLTVHVMTLSAIDASLFLYNLMGTANAEQSLFNAIKNGNSTAKHNAAVVLNLLSTTSGDSLINNLIANKQLADSTRKFIENDRLGFILKGQCAGNISRGELLGLLKSFPPTNMEDYRGFAGNDELACSASNNLKAEDIDVIRAARDRSLRGLSDEALSEYFALTKILMTVRSRSN